MALPAEPTGTIRTPDAIKAELVIVTKRLKNDRIQLSRDGSDLAPSDWSRLVERIQVDARRQDELLGELEDALTWQNPGRLAKQ